jgi:hypothetical protein
MCPKQRGRQRRWCRINQAPLTPTGSLHKPRAPTGQEHDHVDPSKTSSAVSIMLSCFPAGMALLQNFQTEPAGFNAQWMHLYLYGRRLTDRLLIWPCHLQHAYCQFIPISKVQITERCFLIHGNPLQYTSKLHWPSSLNEGRSYYYCSSSLHPDWSTNESASNYTCNTEETLRVK